MKLNKDFGDDVSVGAWNGEPVPVESEEGKKDPCAVEVFEDGGIVAG